MMNSKKINKNNLSTNLVYRIILIFVGFGLITWPYIVVKFGQYPVCMDKIFLGLNNLSGQTFFNTIHLPSIILGLIVASLGFSLIQKRINMNSFLISFGIGAILVFIIQVTYIATAFHFSGSTSCNL